MMPHDCLMFVPRDIGAQIMSLVLGKLVFDAPSQSSLEQIRVPGKATGAKVIALDDGTMKRSEVLLREFLTGLMT